MPPGIDDRRFSIASLFRSDQLVIGRQLHETTLHLRGIE